MRDSTHEQRKALTMQTQIAKLLALAVGVQYGIELAAAAKAQNTSVQQQLGKHYVTDEVAVTYTATADHVGAAFGAEAQDAFIDLADAVEYVVAEHAYANPGATLAELVAFAAAAELKG